MILIADSGSTKCDWKLIDGEVELASVSTMGFNPFFHSEVVIANALREVPQFIENAGGIGAVFMYSAGCSSKDLNAIVERGLAMVFPEAEIHVDHDVLGAALAANQGEPGIACILGTGSNSCYYDGQTTYEVIPSLAYILGDEGSGSWYGKQLLRDYLYKEPIPEALRNELLELGHTKDSILENIYKKPHANVYLASFMKVLANHNDTEYVRTMIHNGMREFLVRHVCCFQNFRDVKTNFVGSIAFHFEDVLRQEAQKLGISIGNIIQKPIDGLVSYHMGRS